MMFRTFIKSLASLVLLATILIVAAGCQGQSNRVGIGDDMDMEEARIQNILDLVLNDMITEEEFLEFDESTINQVLNRFAAMFPPSDEEIEERRERQRLEREERRRFDLEYILGDTSRGRTSPSTEGAADADLQTIERFVFTDGHAHGGHGLAIDITHDMVYFDPRAGSNGLSILRLDENPFYAKFINNDLERLIQAIEESNLRNWPERIEGEWATHTTNWGSTWTVGIKFSDGVFLRRSGGGATNSHPPEDEWRILVDFINTLGQEVIERHAAETAQAEEETQDE